MLLVKVIDEANSRCASWLHLGLLVCWQVAKFL